MKKTTKIAIVSYFTFLALLAIVVNVNKQGQYSGFEISVEDIVRQFAFSRITDLDKKIIFDSFADIENYPNVLPDNVLAVKIINQTENYFGGKNTFFEADVKEAGVISTLLVEQETRPYNELILKIIGGDIHGTTIIQNFNETDSRTEITTDVLIRVKGILTPFGFLPNYNFEHAFDTILNNFIDYTRKNLESGQ